MRISSIMLVKHNDVGCAAWMDGSDTKPPGTARAPLCYNLPLCPPPPVITITTVQSTCGGRCPDSTDIEIRKDARQALWRAFLFVFEVVLIFSNLKGRV